MSASGITSTTPLSITNLLNANAGKTKVAATSTKTAVSGGSGLTGTSAGTTFLSLLVKELQNQDPTAPMDSTAMVGQMISLNQLDQLISINQTLGGATNTTAATSPAGSSSSLLADRAALQSTALPASSYSAATIAASDPSTTLDFSTLNTSFGGK